MVTILKLKFGQDFEVYFWSRLWGWDLVKILRLKFVRDFVAEDWSTFWAINLVKIWKLKFGQDSSSRMCTNLWHDLKSSSFGESRQPLGPLCLWQCLSTILFIVSYVSSFHIFIPMFNLHTYNPLSFQMRSNVSPPSKILPYYNWIGQINVV